MCANVTEGNFDSFIPAHTLSVNWDGFSLTFAGANWWGVSLIRLLQSACACLRVRVCERLGQRTGQRARVSMRVSLVSTRQENAWLGERTSSEMSEVTLMSPWCCYLERPHLTHQGRSKLEIDALIVELNCPSCSCTLPPTKCAATYTHKSVYLCECAPTVRWCFLEPIKIHPEGNTNVCTNFSPKTFHSKSQTSTSWWRWRKSQWIIKVISIDCLGTAKFHYNPTNICQNISLKAEKVNLLLLPRGRVRGSKS